MRFARIAYVMGAHNVPEHKLVTIYEGADRVYTVRLFHDDYNRTPGYEGVEEAAWDIAAELAGKGNKIHTDDVSLNDILEGKVPGYDA